MNDKEKEVILQMCKFDMNVSEVARKMYSHRNTIVYHLEKIKEHTKLDPLRFYDLVKLREMVSMKEWILIDYDFREKLPEEDCKIWITRTCCTGERWVQKVDFYAEDRDIEWDGTIAWMIAEEGDTQPSPCEEKCIMTIQNVR